MDPKEQTIQTYRRSAKELAAYFRGIGSRTADIERAFGLCGKQKPAVVELGCGDGRDAQEILLHTDRYLGMDISPELLDLARELNPQGRFVVGDLATYEIPSKTDIVFAFASLLHSDREEAAHVMRRVHAALTESGILYLSLKEAPYQSRAKVDRYGIRTFYFYEASDIEAMGEGLYTTVHMDHQVIGETPWFTMALRKTGLPKGHQDEHPQK